MKKICVCLSFLLFLSCMAFPTTAVEPAPKGYSDISGHWAEEVILRWQGAGFMDGYEDGTFRPEAFVTRAELAQILTLAFGLKKQTDASVYWADVDVSAYNDLDEAAWYYPYVEIAGVYIPKYGSPTVYPGTEEYGKGGFLPNKNAMRIHVAEAVCRIKMERDNITIHFPDIYEVKREVNKNYIDVDYQFIYTLHGLIGNPYRALHNYTWLAGEFGLMQGDGDGMFRPYDAISRAELITILDRLLTQLGREP